MTRKDYTECDVCGEPISPDGWSYRWARFRRSWWLTLRWWPRDGWSRKRFDICGDCWPEVLEAAREKIKA